VAVVNLVTSDHWQGLYVNGIVRWQGTRVPVYHALAALRGITVSSFKEYWLDELTFFEIGGELPRSIDDIPRTKMSYTGL